MFVPLLGLNLEWEVVVALVAVGLTDDVEMREGDAISVSFVRGTDGRVWSFGSRTWAVDPSDATAPLVRCQAAALADTWVGVVDAPAGADVVAIYTHSRLGEIGFNGPARPAPAKLLTLSIPVGG